MKKFWSLVTLPLLLWAQDATAQTCTGGTCVLKEDLGVFLQLARDQKCRAETPPKFTSDPITIIIDREGRVYGSGSDPHPFKLNLTWCNYSVTATSQIKLVAAQRVEPTWGFRFRPKFSSGFLFVSAFRQPSPLDAVDVGLLWEGFFYKALNLNIATGFRSLGAGVGLDITRNFGGYVGAAVSYVGWQANPYAGLSFAFW